MILHILPSAFPKTWMPKMIMYNGVMESKEGL